MRTCDGMPAHASHPVIAGIFPRRRRGLAPHGGAVCPASARVRQPEAPGILWRNRQPGGHQPLRLPPADHDRQRIRDLWKSSLSLSVRARWTGPLGLLGGHGRQEQNVGDPCHQQRRVGCDHVLVQARPRVRLFHQAQQRHADPGRLSQPARLRCRRTPMPVS